MKFFKLYYMKKLDKTINKIVEILIDYYLYNQNISSEFLQWLINWNKNEKTNIFNNINNYIISSNNKGNINTINETIKGYIEYFKIIKKDKNQKIKLKMEEYFNTIIQIPAELIIITKQ